MPLLADPYAKAGIKRSRSSRWRAGVLIAVQLLMIAHVVQWLIWGRTLTPLEPSESMETIEHGRVNAGFILFALAILLTLVFGRFFCGWACHFVAYQDFAGWVLKKFGIIPKPFKARLLRIVPLGVAFYMFAWPAVYRWWMGNPAPPLTPHLTTTAFWATFPGWVIGSLTVLLSGCGIVYFLGAKGFCTYACPYGALFGAADKLALGRIRVNENCEHTGHCSSRCTSNVDVASEVLQYGMVVNTGCMKCLDCVSVCPNEALHFGFGPPPPLRATFRKGWFRRLWSAITTKAAANATGWIEEIALIVLFVAVLLCWRGVYNLFPMLMSVGLAGIITYLILLAMRLIYRPEVGLQNLRLKSEGRIRASGWVVMALAIALAGITSHHGFIQFHTKRTDRLLAGIGDVPNMWERTFDPARDLTDKQLPVRDAAMAHLGKVDRWSLIDTAWVHMRWADLLVLTPDISGAERHIRRALELVDDEAFLHHRLGGILFRQGRIDEAIAAYRQAVEIDHGYEPAAIDLGNTLIAAGRLDESIAHFREQLRRHPGHAGNLHHLGSLLITKGQVDEGLKHLLEAVRINPKLAESHFTIGSTYVQQRRIPEAEQHFKAAIEAKPDFADAHYNLGVVCYMQQRLPEAAQHVKEAIRINANDAQSHAFYAQVLSDLGRLEEAQDHLKKAAELDPRYRSTSP